MARDRYRIRRLVRPMLWILFVVLSAGVGNALGISVVGVTSSGVDTSTLARGDILTIDLALHNETNVGVYGLGIAVWGYDRDEDGIANDGLAFRGGSSAKSIFNEIRHLDISLGGLPSLRGDPFEFIDQERNQDHRVVDRGLAVEMLGAISLSPSHGDGRLDVGVNGSLVGDGDAHIRVTFEAVSLLENAELTLNFGIGNPTPTCQAYENPCGRHRNAVAVGEGGRLLAFENASLLVSILADPDFRLPPPSPAPSPAPVSPPPPQSQPPSSPPPWSPPSTRPEFDLPLDGGFDAPLPTDATSSFGSVVPEPGTGILVGVGLALLSLRPARRDRSVR